MKENKFDVTQFADEEVIAMFEEYIATYETKERHTENACKEVQIFDEFCERHFPGNIKKQTEFYDKMMSVAVEFEEGGFVAGFRWALSMMKSGEIQAVS